MSIWASFFRLVCREELYRWKMYFDLFVNICLRRRVLNFGFGLQKGGKINIQSTNDLMRGTLLLGFRFYLFIGLTC